MQVLHVSNQANLSPSHINQVRFANSRISFPVKPNQAIYAHFKHVNGFPAKDGGGISLLRLHGIDTLIDRLVSIKQTTSDPAQKKRLESMISSLRAAEPNTDLTHLVQNKAEELHSVTQSRSAYPQAKNFQALLFSLSA